VVLVEFHLKINPEQRLTRIPKVLAESFGTKWTLIPNTKALVAFQETTELELVQKSLSLIQQDIQLRIDANRSQTKRGTGK
jgi:hypothetical protein